MVRSGYRAHDVPQSCLDEWQEIVDIVADVYDVPAALVMRVWPEQIEVLVASVGAANPYEVNEKEDLGTGLYCETVMSSRQQLQVPNALSDPDWAENPDIKLGMVHYFGVPIVWPDDSMFGTICVLDRKERRHPESLQRLLWLIKENLENRLAEALVGPRTQAFALVKEETR